MGHTDAPISGVGVCASALAVLWLCGIACGADLEFHDIAWPHHDKRTGFLDWSLKAKQARPVGDDEFICSVVELTTYKLMQDGSGQRARKDMVLCADKGAYVRGFARSTAKLSKNIRATLLDVDPDPLHIRVHGEDAVADVEYTSDDARGIRERLITTASKVSAESKSRTLTGTGMRLFDRTNRDPLVPAIAQLVLERNVVVRLTGTGGGEPFPSLPGSAQTARSTEPVTATASCAGKLLYDRLASRAELERDACLVQGDTTMRSDTLALTFEEHQTGTQGEVQLKYLLAEGNVTISTPEEKFSGLRFQWDPAAGRGRLDGGPATMNGGGKRGKADTIEFDQHNQLIMYIGNAEVLLELKAE